MKRTGDVRFLLKLLRHNCSGEKDDFHLKGDGACPEGIPPELQCYHIDMDNPELDPVSSVHFLPSLFWLFDRPDDVTAK